MLKKKFKSVIVIPTFNNHYDIENLSKLFNKSKLKNYFICFVDDSFDKKTNYAIRKNFKKNYKILKGPKIKDGRCEAIKYGFNWSIKNLKVKYFVEMDSDCSFFPDDILLGLKILDKDYDTAIGSKYLIYSKVVKRSFYRRILSYSVSFISKKLFDENLTDYTNAFRCYNKKSILYIITKKKKYPAPAENLNIVLYLIKKRMKIKEFPSKYIGQKVSIWNNGFNFATIKSFFDQFYQTLRIIIYYKFSK